MDGPEEELGTRPESDSAPPSLVYVAPFSPILPPSSRRLSSHFTAPNRPVPSTRRLAYVSLQGRLINADEASSAGAICRHGRCSLSREDAVAWEFFPPIHRFLIVAVIGVAVAESKKNRVIRQLKKSVDLRDQVLTAMQQKLDNLCGQLGNMKDQSEAESKLTGSLITESQFRESFGCHKIKFTECGCWLCDHHHHLLPGEEDKQLAKASLVQVSHLLNAEREERRMSDISDWCSSVTSAAESPIKNLAFDQDVYDLKKECQERDATIKELTSALQSANKAGSKRVSDLEETIRRKNMIITRLKKEVIVLEQKVLNLTRHRRPPSSVANSSVKLPVMLDNLLYDMDSSTSPSSSDSDTPSMNKLRATTDKLNQIEPEPVKDHDSSSAKAHELELVTAKRFVSNVLTPNYHVKLSSVTPVKEQSCQPESAKQFVSDVKAKDCNVKSRSATPLKELSANRKPGSVYSLRQSRVSSSREDFKRTRRPVRTGFMDSAGSTKRWV